MSATLLSALLLIPAIVTSQAQAPQIIENLRPSWVAADQLRLGSAPVLVIGTRPEPMYQLARVAGAARLADGKIVAAEGANSSLRFFDSTGTWLNSVGRRGDGLGEFHQDLSQFFRLPGDTLVAGTGLGDWSYFSASGEFIHRRSSTNPPIPFAKPVHSLTLAALDGSGTRAIGGWSDPTPRKKGDIGVDSVQVIVADARNAVIRSIGNMPAMENSDEGSEVWFGHRAAFASDGTFFYYGYGSSEYAIRVYSKQGSLTRIIKRAWTPTLVTKADIDAFIIEWGKRWIKSTGAEAEAEYKSLREAPFSKSEPAFSQFIPDRLGRLWVREAHLADAPSAGSYSSMALVPSKWSVFSPEGRWLGDVEMPKNFLALDIGADYVLGRAVDANGKYSITMYRLGTSRDVKSSTPVVSTARTLPAAPSLEYERKEAKAFLKQVHGGEGEALHRVQAAHPAALHDRAPSDVKLSEVQHVIAREYGFASWPRMVEYFEEMDRHRNGLRYNVDEYPVEHFEASAQGIMRSHLRGNPLVARMLAHYVPRYYARSIDEILATPITLDEARLAVARERRRVSWDVLIERSSASRVRREQRVWEDDSSPYALARHAILAHDSVGLTLLLDKKPELINPGVIDREWRGTLGTLALSVERDSPTPEARRITDLLESRGADIKGILDEILLGFPHDRGHPHGGVRSEVVQWYLDRGANPEWMPPNGISILEHAIMRYRNGPAIDLIARRVKPGPALWIAAGLGDVAGVRSFVARKGKLTAEGRMNRPDPVAVGAIGGFPPYRDADDLEIMYEAFRIAGWNERWAAMDALLEAGLPVDHAPLGLPPILEAVGNLNVSFAEYLISRGADLDREWPRHGSARSAAKSLVENLHDPHDERVIRMLELCGAGSLEELLAEVDAKRQSPPPPYEKTTRAMQLAADDAARQGQSVVTTENMLVGLLRLNSGSFAESLMHTRTDMAKLRAMIGVRLHPDADPLIGQELPGDATAQAALRVAVREADTRRRDGVTTSHLMFGIMSQEDGAGAHLLRETGTDFSVLSERLKSGM